MRRWKEEGKQCSTKWSNFLHFQCWRKRRWRSATYEGVCFGCRCQVIYINRNGWLPFSVYLSRTKSSFFGASNFGVCGWVPPPLVPFLVAVLSYATTALCDHEMRVIVAAGIRRMSSLLFASDVAVRATALWTGHGPCLRGRSALPGQHQLVLRLGTTFEWVRYTVIVNPLCPSAPSSRPHSDVYFFGK